MVQARPARTLILLAALTLASSATAASAALPGTTTRSDRAAWRTLHHWPTACEAGWRNGAASGAGIAGVWPIPGSGFLVAVDCSLGAYQGTSMLCVLDSHRRPTGPLALHIYQDQGSGTLGPTTTTTVLETLRFSPHRERLQSATSPAAQATAASIRRSGS